MANISGYTPERLAWEREKALIGYKEEQFESLSASISKADTNITAAYSKLSAEVADNKREMISAVSRFQGQQQSGLASARVRAIVELRKLMLTSKIDFAKAAYAPDEAMLRDVRTKVNPSDSTNTKDRSIAEPAWQAYYSALVEGSGNEWGTYREMVNTYGPDTQALGSKGGLEEKRARLNQRLLKEKGGAADYNQAYQAVVDIGGAYEKFLEDNPLLDPNAESTQEAFENDAGIQERLQRVQDPAFIKQLQKAALDVDTGRTDLYRTDALAGITAAERARDRDVALRNAIVVGGGDKAKTADTDRDLMAAWLKRPDVQEWARKNGLRVGRVVEITEQQKADIAAGKIPASTVTKYGMLTDGPDDQKAVNFAYKQMARTPERDLFRRVGFTRSGLANTPIEVEIGADPALYKDPASGKFYKDPADGKYVKFADVSAMPVDEQGNVIGLEVVDTPPPVTVFRGVARPPLVNDAAGSVRFVNAETGEEEYANPDIIRRVNEPGVRRDATKTSLADVVGKATAKGVLKKTGLGQDENDMDIGEKPAQRKAFNTQYPGGGRGSVQARRERSEQLEALPTIPDAALDERFNPRPSTDAAVAEFTQRAKTSDTANSTGSDVTDRRAQPGNAALSQFVTNPKPDASGGVIGVAGRDFRETNLAGAAAKAASDAAATKETEVAKPSGRQLVVEPGRVAPIKKVLDENAEAEAAAKMTVDATTPSLTTPTSSTDPRRRMFKQRHYKKDAEGNPEP